MAQRQWFRLRPQSAAWNAEHNHELIGEDLYVTLLSYDPPTQTISLRVFVNPLVVWIWIGGGIVAIGAVFAIWPDRRRVPAVEPVSEPVSEPASEPARVPVEA